MSPFSSPTAFRFSTTLLIKNNPTHRTLHTSPSQQASILFALQGLSNSREIQHFNKISRLSRIEHSPSLKLIQTSEVEAYPLPSPPPKPAFPIHTRGAINNNHKTTISTARLWDTRALRVGRAILAQNARQTNRLRRDVKHSQQKLARQAVLMDVDRMAWRAEKRRLQNEMRAAGVWIVASIGAATALAMWRFWPQREVSSRDSAVLASSIITAGDAGLALSMPAAAVALPSVAEPIFAESATMMMPSADAVPVAAPDASKSSWWKGIFWKQPQ